MTQALRAPVHLFDYLGLEEASAERHEYVAGEIYAMVGGSLRHNKVAGNIYRLLTERLEGTPCQSFINDVKLHVQAADSVYYPDVLVHCSRADADATNVVHDAVLVVEVTSDSTAGTDRREKLIAYRKLPGLRAYWIVSQEQQRVEVHARDSTGQFFANAYSAGDVLPAEWLSGDNIPIARFYAGTDVAA